MQSLNLTSETVRTDGRLKSLFWPTVANAWDVDYLGQQGFWFCAFVAAFQLGMGILTGHPIQIVVALIAASIYFVGGMGVREKSWPAASCVFALYLLDTLTLAFTHLALTPGFVLRIFFLALLFANVRATLIASRWQPTASEEDQPQRFDVTLRDKLVDLWPPRFWPRLRTSFYAVGAIWLLASLLAFSATVAIKAGLLPTPIIH